MAIVNIKIKPQLNPTLTLTITESEARALRAITGYSTEDFLKFFYQHMGRYYLEPHEKGVYSLFESLKGLGGQLANLDEARKIVEGAK